MEGILIPIVIAIFFFFAGIRIIRPTHRGLVERFGKYHRFANLGFNWIIPMVENIYLVNITEQMVDAEPQEIIKHTGHGAARFNYHKSCFQVVAAIFVAKFDRTEGACVNQSLRSLIENFHRHGLPNLQTAQAGYFLLRLVDETFKMDFYQFELAFGDILLLCLAANDQTS